MIVIASANGAAGIETAVDILRSGGSALDAVEAATRVIEADVNDHTVGVGGYPNAQGIVELDASIMEGATRRAGAVAALRDYPHAISIARAILEHLPQHAFLVAEGAARFARERGFESANILTVDAELAWKQHMDNVLSTSKDISHEEQDMIALSRALLEPKKTTGTVNFIAQDKDGHIASAVSTSGWSFKYPGRVGDSPVIGAGNYCDDRFGACACTGHGEWAIRASTARMVISALQHGLSLNEACREAFYDLHTIPLPVELEPTMNLIALNRQGGHIGAATLPDRVYIWQTTDMKSYETSPRIVIGQMSSVSDGS